MVKLKKNCFTHSENIKYLFKIKNYVSAAPLMQRTWRPPEVSNCNQTGREDAVLTRTQILAEVWQIIDHLSTFLGVIMY